MGDGWQVALREGGAPRRRAEEGSEWEDTQEIGVGAGLGVTAGRGGWQGRDQCPRETGLLRDCQLVGGRREEKVFENEAWRADTPPTTKPRGLLGCSVQQPSSCRRRIPKQGPSLKGLSHAGGTPAQEAYNWVPCPRPSPLCGAVTPM